MNSMLFVIFDESTALQIKLCSNNWFQKLSISK